MTDTIEVRLLKLAENVHSADPQEIYNRLREAVHVIEQLRISLDAAHQAYRMQIKNLHEEKEGVITLSPKMLAALLERVG